MNYFLETEVKPVQVDNGLSLHQRYQSTRYRAIRFPGSEQASIRSTALDTRFCNDPKVVYSLAGALVGQARERLATQPFTDYGQPEIALGARGRLRVNPFASDFNEVG